jgi:outer membrane scaffolding protein for murein synthesis (MipA/OmpV family)
LNRPGSRWLAATALLVGLAGLAELAEAQDTRSDTGLEGSIGIALLDTDRFPGSEERRQRLIPAIDLTLNDRYYFRFTRLGAWLWQSEDYGRDHGWRAGPALRPRFRVTPPPSVPDDDKEERPFSLDTGLSIQLKHRWLDWSFSLFGDGFQRHEGHSAEISVSSFLPFNERVRLLPALSLEYESARLSRFYYAVDEQPLPDAAFIPGVSLLLLARTGERSLVTLGIFANRQPSDRQRSGLVASRSSVTAVAGLSYRF